MPKQSTITKALQLSDMSENFTPMKSMRADKLTFEDTKSAGLQLTRLTNTAPII